MQIVSNIFAVLATISLLVILFVKPSWSYYALTVVSFATTSVIVAGSYPALDEILLTVISITSLITIFKSGITLKTPKFSPAEKFKIIFILYLLGNTLISATINFDKSNLRFLLLFVNISILLLVLPRIPQKIEKLQVVCSVAIKLNLYLWVTYWLIMKLMHIDWAEQQAVTWAGTAYAAIVPSLGLVILMAIGEKKPGKKPPRGWFLYYSISVFASAFYDSRVLVFAVLLATLILCIRFKSLKSVAIVILIFCASQTLAGVIVSKEISTNIRVDYSLVESAQFINNPRTSDTDRSDQIRCSTSLMRIESGPTNFLFGNGQNAHKKVMYECLPTKLKILNGGDPVRPVGYAAFIIDFGWVGLLGLLSLLILIAKDLIKYKSGKYYVLILFWAMSFSLVTNNLEHALIYQILVFDLLQNLIRSNNAEKNR